MEKLSVVISLLIVATSRASKLPPDFKICNLWGEHTECLPEAITIAMKTLKPGDPKLKIMPLDPLQISRVNIVQGHGPVNINLEMTDIEAEGISDGVARSARVQTNNDKNEVFATIYIENLVIKAQYQIDGKILLLPIKGNGPVTFTLTNTLVDAELDVKNISKKGVPYLHSERFHIDMKPEKVTMDFQNLFNGNKALGKQMNQVLNDNSMEILRELKDAINMALGQAFLDIANRVFHGATLEELSTAT